MEASSRLRIALTHLQADAKYLTTFAGRKTPREVITTSVILGGVAALVLLDDELREEVRGHRNDTLVSPRQRAAGFHVRSAF